MAPEHNIGLEGILPIGNTYRAVVEVYNAQMFSNSAAIAEFRAEYTPDAPIVFVIQNLGRNSFECSWIEP